MAGQPQPNAPLTPYGHQAAQPMPVFNPAAGMKRPGETACKVWGIILLIFGLLGVVNMLLALGLMFGGVSAGSFAPTLSPEARVEYDRFFDEMIQSSLSRPTFWINSIGEMVLVGLSIGAGALLVIRPRPLGARLALARAALVLLLLPAYGYEQIKALETSTDVQMRTMEIEMRSKGGKPMNKDFVDTFSKVMTGVSYGLVLLVVAAVVAINGILAYQMSRPHIKTYLASVNEQAVVIPGYDPSMGLIGPPGNAPTSGASPPGSFPSQTQVPPPQG